MIRNFLFIVLGLFVFTGCDFDEPTIGGYSNFKFGKLEGKTLNVSFDVTVDNDNGYGFKLKKGKLNLLVNNLDIGTIELTDKIKVKRKSERVYNVPLKLALSDGALFRVMKLVDADKFELKLDGKVRGSVFGFGKNFDVHETRTLSSGDLQFEGLLEGLINGMKN